MTSLNGSSREADKFVVRLPDGMRDEVTIAANADGRSINSLIIVALREYLDGRTRANVLLDALAHAVEAKGVTNASA